MGEDDEIANLISAMKNNQQTKTENVRADDGWGDYPSVCEDPWNEKAQPKLGKIFRKQIDEDAWKYSASADIIREFGWKPGMGLGREFQGDPIFPAIEATPGRAGLATAKELHDKALKPDEIDPVDLLSSHVRFKNWSPAMYFPQEISNGKFICKIIVNGEDYCTRSYSLSREEARKAAAFMLCQKLKLVDADGFVTHNAVCDW